MDIRSEREWRAWGNEYYEISETMGTARAAERVVGRESQGSGHLAGFLSPN